jgi:hypothetical protein
VKPSAFNPSRRIRAQVFLVFLAVLLCALFYRSFFSGYTPYSNDGPLARLLSACHRLPAAFTGVWQDLEGVGYREVGAVPDVTYGLRLLLGPVLFSKFYAPFALFLLGVGAWVFFRQARLSSAACALGALAAVLNATFFSAACWGVAAHPIMVAMTFLALAALLDTSSPRRWLKAALAGLAIGMAVTEGDDIGALFSVAVAGFVLWQAWALQDQPWFRRVNVGTGRVAVVALFAAFLAAQAISSLVSTQIKGVAGAQQDPRTKQEHWDWATQWSLPKREALGIVVPGLFGYLMETPDGGVYWGAVGRDVAWTRWLEDGGQGSRPAGFLRLTGGGNYAGILVVLVACWGAAQAFRKTGSAFDIKTRRLLWFWIALGLIALLLAFGRHAPFYRFVYALPYASTVRNPAKFLHLLAFALVILFAYGFDALWRVYFQTDTNVAGKRGITASWRTAGRFEKNFTRVCGALLLVALIGWCVYATWRPSLVEYLQRVQFDETAAREIAGFSIRQVGWFVVFLAASIALLARIFSRDFTGAGARLGVGLLAALLVADLARANFPFIAYVNYANQLARSPILDFLRQSPFEHRVACLPAQLSSGLFQSRFGVPSDVLQAQRTFSLGYRSQWLSHSFQGNDIQSSDVFEMSRSPQDIKSFSEKFQSETEKDIARVVPRFWQLTNTRYLLGAVGFYDILNDRFDAAQRRFRVVQRFEMNPHPGISDVRRWDDLEAMPTPDGPLALFEFSGALPRAGLYTQWEVITNDAAMLDRLTSPAFDPQRTVLVAGDLPRGASGGADTNATGGRVEFVSYSPKQVVLTAQAASDSVLLLNDHYDRNWNVVADGKPAPLLRCNYLMRGVFLGPGAHTLEFRFQPPHGGLYVSLSAIALGCVVLVFVWLAETRAIPQPAAPAAKSEPEPPRPLAVPRPRAASRPA